MVKKFSIIKMRDLHSDEERIIGYSLGDDDVSREKVLRKLNRSLKGMELFAFRMDESLPMYLLPGLSRESVSELSRRLYFTAYAVCRKKEKSEKALRLFLLKDSAMRYKASIPVKTVRKDGKDVSDPNLYVKELRLYL